MMKINKSLIGKVLKFTGSLVTLVVTTFFIQSCMG